MATATYLVDYEVFVSDDFKNEEELEVMIHENIESFMDTLFEEKVLHSQRQYRIPFGKRLRRKWDNLKTRLRPSSV